MCGKGDISTWLGGKSGYSLTGIPRMRQVLSPCRREVSHWSGLRSKIPSLLSTLCSGWDERARGHGEELVGAITPACELEKALPDLQEGNSSASALPTSKGGRLYSPRGHWTPSPPSSIGGDKLVSLDLRTESANFSRSPVQRTEKKLSGWCSPKLEKKYVLQSKYLPCSVWCWFLPFFLLNHRHFRISLQE